MTTQLENIIKVYRPYTLSKLQEKYEVIRNTPGYVSTKGVTMLAIKMLIEEKLKKI
jgi:hypothetical protein